MADRVGRELELLFQSSAYQAEEDLVFGQPAHTGHPLERSQVSKPFKRALKRAGVREVRFHDLRHTFGTQRSVQPEGIKDGIKLSTTAPHVEPRNAHEVGESA